VAASRFRAGARLRGARRGRRRLARHPVGLGGCPRRGRSTPTSPTGPARWRRGSRPAPCRRPPG
jgi:hypothetical protein